MKFLVHAHLMFLASIMMLVLPSAYSEMMSSLSSAVVNNDDDFGNWLNHIDATCPVDPDEDSDNDDHLPGRPASYDDHVVSKEAKERSKEKTQARDGGRRLGESKPSRKRTITRGRPMIVVAKDGSGDVKTIQAAIDLVPQENKQRIIIYVKKGIYREKLIFPKSKPFITLKGEGSALTYIEWGDTASTVGDDGKPLSTFGSASVAVQSDDFIALDISFKNTAPAPKSGEIGKQAVALRVQGDRAAFYRCGFYGAQDTLYDKSGRHYYYKCYIEGSIDFIFGNARSLFVKCHLHSIATPWGSISAQKRLEPEENTGYSFVYCMVTGSGTIYLGRAWGPYSRVVYAHTYFDNIIRPEGWNDFGLVANQKKVYYGEYKCFGPGAARTGRVPWSRILTDQQARPFLSISFIDGKSWLPNL
ncbi:hypothetical protein KP509_35G046900 [Ceratopteris richardii]|uniref:Pectinesterase n=1 Tax=Ceratopteris richardii TaxID=49495 RepID=A0A8T2QGC0_CERRI|nr:hypothetical protein KP509_35G046900 [Ceratopteris richardii]